MKNVKDLIDQLPPEYQRELEDFAEFLLQRSKAKRQKGELKLDWRGGLKEKKGEFTSVELQHKARDWWAE